MNAKTSQDYRAIFQSNTEEGYILIQLLPNSPLFLKKKFPRGYIIETLCDAGVFAKYIFFCET